MKLVYDSYQAPLGLIHILMDERGLSRVELTLDGWQECLLQFGEINRDEARCRDAVVQFDEYFQGKRREFALPLSIEGPTFSRKVWQELLAIPYGETRSYAEVALAIGQPKSYRAVGQANRRNPLPIIIPCHRVVGKDGALTGYIGKQHIGMKEYLLEMERKNKES
jgi:methylated-DNA-[protein]-cysteine S-methyltransferase